MATDRTLVTELATALGMLPYADLPSVLSARPRELQIDTTNWEQLDALHATDAYADSFAVAFENGKAFAASTCGLAGRPPHLIEWTGGRRPSGDEVAPIDLRVDHVYLVSCKYLSANIANSSPARFFDGLLATTGSWDRTDWYLQIAPDEYQDLYRACRNASGLDGLPENAADITGPHREMLKGALRDRLFPEPARAPYQELCKVVSIRSAERWLERLQEIPHEEAMFWRLLRIGSAPYFLLGADGTEKRRLRIDTNWDWHHAFALRELSIFPAGAGQPQVDWIARITPRSPGRASTSVRAIRGHVEIRWSHGRFAQPPEAKVYLDTPVDQIPGYHALDTELDSGDPPHELDGNEGRLFPIPEMGTSDFGGVRH